MFALKDDEIASVQAAWDTGGELAAAVELRRLFPGIADLAKARTCARTISAWKPPASTAPEETDRSHDSPEHVAEGSQAASDRTGTLVPFGRRSRLNPGA